MSSIQRQPPSKASQAPKRLVQSPLLRAMQRDLARSGLTWQNARSLSLQLRSAEAMSALTKGSREQPAYLIPYFRLDGKIDPLYFRARFLEPQAESNGAALAARNGKKPATTERRGSFTPAAMGRNGSEPENVEEAAKGKGTYRYWQPFNSIPRLYMPPILKDDKTWAEVAKDTSVTIYITEGEKKAAKACVSGVVCAGVGGVWNWKSKKAGIPVIADLKTIDWRGRNVIICYDSDVAGRLDLQGALHALARQLTSFGANVAKIDLPPKVDAKVGLDDFLVEQGIDAFLALEPEAFDLTRELLELSTVYALLREPPAILRRRDDGSFNLLNEAEFKVLERNRVAVTTDAGGRPRKVYAANEWLEWKMRPEVSRLCYEPRRYDEPRDLGDGSYNLWQGWGAGEPEEGNVKPFLRLCDHLLKDVSAPEVRRWFFQWLAYPIQNPGAKLLTAMVIFAGQGVGKNLFGLTMQRVYGPANAEVISQQQLEGRFNKWMENKQFVIADEVIGSNKRMDRNRLKAYITQELVNVEAKYRDPYTLRDTINYLFISNDPTPVYLEDDDRRFFVINAPDELSRREAEIYNAWYRKPASIRAVFWYLLTQVSLEGFNPRAKPPMTQAKQQVIESGRSDLESFIINEVIAGYETCFAIADKPTRCDLQTPQGIAELYDLQRRNSSRTSSAAVGHILARQAMLKRIVRLKAVKLLDAQGAVNGKVIKPYAFRNLEYWNKIARLPLYKADDPAAQKIREHWEKTASAEQQEEVGKQPKRRRFQK